MKNFMEKILSPNCKLINKIKKMKESYLYIFNHIYFIIKNL